MGHQGKRLVLGWPFGDAGPYILYQGIDDLFQNLRLHIISKPDPPADHVTTAELSFVGCRHGGAGPWVHRLRGLQNFLNAHLPAPVIHLTSPTPSARQPRWC